MKIEIKYKKTLLIASFFYAFYNFLTEKPNEDLFTNKLNE